jgi:CheY-like chemotaxis protein
VLVVDDEPAVARATSRILERTQDVVALHGGLEALGKLQEDPHFDVILCDLMMADLTGMDLHDRLAATAPELAERMIFMTGGAFTPRAQQFLAGLASRAQGQGRVRVIEKPCDPRQLQAVVEAAILHEP